MAQFSLEMCPTCKHATLRRVAMAAGMMALCVLLIGGCSRGKKPSAGAPRSSPVANAADDEKARAQAEARAKAQADAEAQAQAKADAKARATEMSRQRQEMSREATALNQEHNVLNAQANSASQKARQLRSGAAPIDREGQTNIAAGEAMCESFDCERGCAVVARGQAKVDKAKAMRAEADKLDAEAIAMREEADELAARARELMATLPRN